MRVGSCVEPAEWFRFVNCRQALPHLKLTSHMSLVLRKLKWTNPPLFLYYYFIVVNNAEVRSSALIVALRVAPFKSSQKDVFRQLLGFVLPFFQNSAEGGELVLQAGSPGVSTQTTGLPQRSF